MIALTLGRAGLALAVVLFGCVLASACKSGGEDEPTYCESAKASYRTCEGSSGCDLTLAAGCGTLGKALSAATLTAVQNCLESGICGNAGCLTRAQKAVAPTQAHLDLAAAYCSECVPGLEGCGDDFYAPSGRLPGLLVLPYSESVAVAIKDACTTGERCQSTFTNCALDTIAQVVGSALGTNVANCAIDAFQSDDEGTVGPRTGPETTTCTTDNCKGCCKDDNCLDGATEAACGIAGAACETCSGMQACTAGKCKEPCGPTNCAGCCDGNTCVDGTVADKCGRAGEACTACSRRGASYICSKNQCIDGSCNATCTTGCCTWWGCQPGNLPTACGSGGQACVDCGYGNTCGSAKTCVLDVNSTWDFVVASASLPGSKKSGSAWDVFGGAPDPYLVGYSSTGQASHRGETSKKDDTHSPVWNETVLKSISASELLGNLSFEIWDDDGVGDDYVGGCAIKVDASTFDGALHTQTCPATASSGEITISFRFQKPN